MPVIKARALLLGFNAALNPVTWNALDKSSNISLSGNSLVATATSATDGGVRANLVRSTGKWYFELKTTVVSGGDTGAGVASPTADLAAIGNVASLAVIEFKGGNVYKNGSVQFNLGAMSANDIIRCAYDADNHRYWCARQSGNWNNNGSNDPATNTGGLDVSAFDGSGLFPVCCMGANGDSWTLNVGNSAFGFSVPSGFTAWKG